MTIAFTVFSRAGCHLCDVMVEELRALTEGDEVVIDVVDVDSAEALRAAYGVHVPVLMLGDEEVCRYRLDRGRVEACLSAARRTRGGSPGAARNQN